MFLIIERKLKNTLFYKLICILFDYILSLNIHKLIKIQVK